MAQTGEIQRNHQAATDLDIKIRNTHKHDSGKSTKSRGLGETVRKTKPAWKPNDLEGTKGSKGAKYQHGPKDSKTGKSLGSAENEKLANNADMTKDCKDFEHAQDAEYSQYAQDSQHTRDAEGSPEIDALDSELQDLELPLDLRNTINHNPGMLNRQLGNFPGKEKVVEHDGPPEADDKNTPDVTTLERPTCESPPPRKSEDSDLIVLQRAMTASQVYEKQIRDGSCSALCLETYLEEEH